MISTGYTGMRVIGQYNTGGISNIDGVDFLDMVVGVIGVTASVVIVGLVTNPVTLAACGAIGTGALVYGIARLVYDISQEL